MTIRKHEVPDELLSGLLANSKKPEDLIDENGLLKQLTKLRVEKALDAEMTEHLAHDKHEPVANAIGNTRNGRSRKILKGEFGELPIAMPCDRHGSFEPLRPKEALDAMRPVYKQPRSSALYENVTRRISLQRCVDPAYLRLRNQLQAWFPRA